MAKKDTGKVPSPGPGLTPSGAWSESSASAAPPAPPTADGGSGVAGGAPQDALPTDGGGSGTDSLQGIHAALSALTAQFSGAFAGVSEQIANVAGRLETLESERGGSDSGESQRRSSSDSGSEGSSVSNDSYAAPEYLQVIGKDNRHWNAAQRELDADQRPRRYSMYGYEPYDELRRGKHKGGGVLGLTMRYSEPAALYLQTAINGVENCRDSCDPGDPLASDLDACANTLKGVYGLINTLRTLVSTSPVGALPTLQSAKGHRVSADVAGPRHKINGPAIAVSDHNGQPPRATLPAITSSPACLEGSRSFTAGAEMDQRRGSADVSSSPIKADRCYFAFAAERRAFPASQIDAWLGVCLAHLGASPPAGEKWTGHSLRKGAASGAASIGVPLHVICYAGGWSITSKAVFDYIAPPCPRSLACRRFFGWLAPS